MKKVTTTIQPILNSLIVGLFLLVPQMSLATNSVLTMEQLSYPFSPQEISSCRFLAKKVSDLKNCPELGNCQEIYTEYYEDGSALHSSRFSFQKLIETGSGITLRSVGLPLATTTSYAVDFLIFKRALAAIRVGFTIGRFLTLVSAGAASWALGPIAYALLPENKCKNNIPSSDDYDACMELNQIQLSGAFKQYLQLAVDDPHLFTTQLHGRSSGFVQRISCLLLEDISNEFDKKFDRTQCDGRLLEIPQADKYIVKKDGHLMRREGRDLAFTFAKEGHEISVINYNKQSNYRTPRRIINEAKEIRILSPRINEILHNCVISPTPQLSYN